MSLASSVEASRKVVSLRDRAAMLGRVRAFFAERGILEVDCPILSDSASVDLHIELLACTLPDGTKRYLHSSPEYGMKRLLALGIGDIYQLSHVFRDDEVGAYHNPEFMMAEWYRQGCSFEAIIGETCDFAELFLGPLPRREWSYEELFQHHLNIHPFEATNEMLVAAIKACDLPLSFDPRSQDRDDLLSLLLSSVIQPYLGTSGLDVLAFFPPSQAALAQVCARSAHPVAERFELFYRGVELANGYHELVDPVEQRRRFVEANDERQKRGKAILPIDERFLGALATGLPDASGVAVGFDRLMMLRHDASHIADVIAWGWERA